MKKKKRERERERERDLHWFGKFGIVRNIVEIDTNIIS